MTYVSYLKPFHVTWIIRHISYYPLRLGPYYKLQILVFSLRFINCRENNSVRNLLSNRSVRGIYSLSGRLVNEKRSSVCRIHFSGFCPALLFILGFIRQHRIWARVLLKEEYKSKNRHNVGWFFEGVLYFGWPNQPSSGTMKILHWDVFLCTWRGLVWPAEI